MFHHWDNYELVAARPRPQEYFATAAAAAAANASGLGHHPRDQDYDGPISAAQRYDTDNNIMNRSNWYWTIACAMP